MLFFLFIYLLLLHKLIKFIIINSKFVENPSLLACETLVEIPNQ